MANSVFGAITTASGAFARHGRRSTFKSLSGIRGMTQFKRNMQELSKTGDTAVMKEGFVAIAKDMKSDMDAKTHSLFAPVTDKYMRWKASRMRKRKGGSTYVTSLRERGIVANPFTRAGRNKSYVAVHYKYAPHGHFFESGTQERYTRSGAYRGRIRPNKFKFFSPVVSAWKRTGRLLNRVERVVRTAVDAQARGLTV
jgi:hypothetical protein